MRAHVARVDGGAPRRVGSQGLKNEVREALDRLVEACTSLHDCLKGSYVALERPWNISDARKGVSDVLALAHLGGYSLFAPPW